VDRVELAIDTIGDGLAIRTLAVEHGDLRAALVQKFGAGTPHPRSAADDDDLLPADLHSDLLVRILVICNASVSVPTGCRGGMPSSERAPSRRSKHIA